MKKIAIVYHSGYGHTKKVAAHIFETLKKDSEVETFLFTADEALKGLDTLDSSTTIIFGSPTYMGGPSADFKKFADATSKKWMRHAWKNKLAAGFTNSATLAGDKMATLQYFSILAAQHGMVWIGLAELSAPTKEGHGGTPDMINRVGSWLGLATQSDNVDPAHTPAPGDLKTAELFAQRIAQITKIWPL